jgi:hypothetical protein
LDKIECEKCKCALESVKTTGNYLGYRFQVELQGCPKCGQVFVPEELVRTKIAELESALEQK